MLPVNLVIGGVIGAVTTYVYKDEKANKWAVETGKKLKEGGISFLSTFKKKPVEATEATPKTVEIVETATEKTNA